MKKQSRTDWARIDRQKDYDIDFSDNPPLARKFFEEAAFWPGRKRQITLRLDPDTLALFRGTGKSYQTTINAVLRKYVEAQKRRAG